MTDYRAGENVRVAGWRGTYRITGTSSDGSLRLWGGPKFHYQFRNAPLSQCRRIRKGGPERLSEMAAPASRKAGKR